LAALGPAIYVFRGFGDLGGRDVDARLKAGHDDWNDSEPSECVRALIRFV
jgi:hypothetical protein